MPRTYKKKIDARPYANYTADTVNSAVAAVNGGQSMRSAAKEFKIPHATLQRKLNGRYTVVLISIWNIS